jgi:hypothetical protein
MSSLDNSTIIKCLYESRSELPEHEQNHVALQETHLKSLAQARVEKLFR